MEKKIRGLLSILLSLALILGMMPGMTLTVFAGDVECPYCYGNNTQNMGGNSYYCNDCCDSFTFTPGPACPECGSTNTEQVSGDNYFCKNCYTPFHYVDAGDTIEGAGTEDDPYLIGSLASLMSVCNEWPDEHEDETVYIELKDNITFGSSTFYLRCNVNLNLNDYTVGEDEYTRFYVENGTLSVSGAAGSIYNLELYNGAAVYLNSGDIKNVHVDSDSSFVMNGGSVSNDLSCYGSSTTTINDGTVVSVYTDDQSTLTINDGTFSNGSFLVYDESTVIINDGTFEGITLYEDCICTVNGGTFTSASFCVNGGTLQVTNGDFSGIYGGILNSGGAVEVTGGTFGCMLTDSGTTVLKGGNYEKTNDYGDDEQGYLETYVPNGFNVEETTDYFTVVPVPVHTVTWQNWDGTTLETDAEVEEGETPTYDGATPTKAEDETNTYTFSGWSPEVSAVASTDVTYTATFSATSKAPAEKEDQTAPTGLTATKASSSTATDGKISGVTDAMEYQKDGDTTWTAVENNSTEITGLTSGTYKVRYAETADKNASTATTVEVGVKEDQTAPTGLTATKASSSTATDGKISGVTDAMEYQKDGATAWTAVENNSTEITGLNSGTYKVRYAETADKNASTAATVEVGVKEDQTAPTGLAATKASSSTATDGKIGGVNDDMEYQKSGESIWTAVEAGKIEITGLTTGTYRVRYAETADKNASPATSVVVGVKTTQTITASDVTTIYGDTDKFVSASVTDPAEGSGAISYAVKSGSENYIDVNASTGALTIKAVPPTDGKAYVTVTAAETNDCLQATKDVTVTISKADSTPATVTANNRTYDSTEKPLVTVTGTATGGTMQYALGTDDQTAPTKDWNEAIPAGTDAGTYYVWYKVVGDVNHSNTEAQCVTAKIRAAISKTVTFKVANGSWNDGTTADKTVTLTGYEGDTLKLTSAQIPAVGSKAADTFKAGSWDVAPSTNTAITANTTYTYTYAKKDTISAKVTFKVANGSWNDGTTADKTVTLTGYEGDTLKLTADQIPAVGKKAAEGYKAGSWNVVPDTKTAISKNTTYTYTYVVEEVTPPDDKDGEVSVPEEKQKDNFAGGGLDNTGAEVKESVLTEEDKEQIQAGKNVEVWLEVTDQTETVAEEEKAKVEEAGKELGSGYRVGAYMDLKLWKQVAGKQATKVEEVPNGKVKVSFTIPKGMRKDNATYVIIGLHNGKTFLLRTTLDKINWKLSFETNQFSTYALAYQEQEPETKKSVTEIFTDLDPNAWYINAVQFVYDHALMVGKSATTFDPNAPITREQMVQVIYSYEGKPEAPNANPFNDVVEGSWYQNAVLWANANGVAVGYGAGRFGVADATTREQMVRMLYSYAILKGYDISVTPGASDGYADSATISGWAKEAMDWAVEKGIIYGKGTQGMDKSQIRLDPAGKASRVECAQVLTNFKQKIEK